MCMHCIRTKRSWSQAVVLPRFLFMTGMAIQSVVFQLDVPAFHIAADETDSRLFVSLMDEEHNWKISVYDLK